MRITNGMSATSMLRSLQGSNERLDKLQEQLSTGRRLNRPSDDPVGISRSLKYSRDLSENEQYTRNIQDAASFLDATDTALDGINKIMLRLKEISVYGSNDSLPPQSRTALAQETDQLLGQLVELGNSSFGGRYLFAGEDVLTSPYTTVGLPVNNVTYNGNNGKLNVELAPRITDYINYTGEEIFGLNANDIFDHTIQLRDQLSACNMAGIQAAQGLLENDFDNLLMRRSEVGAKSNKLELALNRMQGNYTNVNQQIANNDDTDIAQATMQLKLEENVYKSALAVGARIIPPSLVDFLQ